MANEATQHTEEFTADIIQTKDGWVVIMWRGNAVMYRSSRNWADITKAKAHIRRAIYRMIDCSHKLVYDTSELPYPVDCDAAGNEIMGWETSCPLCGYVDYMECD